MSVEIKINPGGPAVVTVAQEEQIFVTDENGFTKSHKKIALCQCGKSTNMPFCSGAHKPKIKEEGEIYGNK